MALTPTNRGSGGNGVSATSYAFSPTSTIAAGSLAVLCIQYDNSGTAGVDPYSSISDSVGNTWTPRIDQLVGAGTINAGGVLRFFTSLLVTQLTSSDTVTVSFGAVSVPAKAFAFHGAAASVGVPTYKTGAAADAAASGTPSITTGTITDTNLIVCAMGVEYEDAVITADSDTTNGSWSAQQIGNAGLTTTASQSIASQSKVVTATATQTYNLSSVAASSNAIGWIEIEEIVAAATSRPTILVSNAAVQRAASY